MQAAGDALEEFLIGLERHREDQFLIAAEAADEAVAGDERAERTRVHVGARNILRTPDLAGDVAGLFVPGLDVVHTRELVVEEQKALRQVVVNVLALVVVAGEISEADAGLRPVCVRGLRCGIKRGDRKPDLVSCRGDDMVYDHAVLHVATQLHRLLVVTERHKLGGVTDRRVVPVRVS